MTTHFYLGLPDKKGLCAIYLRCREDSFVCNLNTRERVEKKHWDAKRQRVKPSAPAAVHVAEYLVSVERAALDGARQARLARKSLTVRDLEQAVFGRGGGGTMTLEQQYKEYVASLRGVREAGTVSTKESDWYRLAGFEKVRGPMPAASWGKAAAGEYAKYLAAAGLANLTIHKRLAALRTFLRFCHEQGWCDEACTRIPTWSKAGKKAEVHLSEAELNTLETIELETSELDRARSLMLIQCWTGLRYSDTQILGPQHHQGDYIVLIATKTKGAGKPTVIPLLPPAARLLDAMAWKPPRLSNQQYNSALKVLGQRLGMTQEIEEMRASGSASTRSVVRRWERLTTHSGRDTFASLMRSRGVDVSTLRKMMGHTSTAMTEQYDKRELESVLKGVAERFK